ncbi:glycosyl transferase family 90-domain-containing protein [Mycena rebaudengoi]|nr:glycosyl transferase family 90-domain-containing protein [Mycena rebaudengoi]
MRASLWRHRRLLFTLAALTTFLTTAAFFAPHDMPARIQESLPFRKNLPVPEFYDPDRQPLPAKSHPSSEQKPPKGEDPLKAAKKHVDDLFARQSTALAQARGRYTLRNNRPPPRNFDDFFRYARDNSCLVDDYDQVDRDFAPFYEISKHDKQWFRKRVELGSEKMSKDPAGMTALNINDGEVHRPSYSGSYFDGDWEGTYKKFLPHLPRMEILFNGRDEPRVVFDTTAQGPLFSEPHKLNATALVPKDANPFHMSPRPTIDFFRDKPGCGVPTTEAGLSGGVQEDVSFLLSASSAEFTTDLYPLLSMAKLSTSRCFADIVVPGQFYYRDSWWAGKFEYPSNKAWGQRKSQLYWRGKSNGGEIHGDNFRSFARFRLITLARAHLASLNATSPQKAQEQALLDVALTDFHREHCLDAATCDPVKIKQEFEIGENRAPREDAYNYKYLLDVDGNTFSGRYLGLLRSGGLVFKSTAYTEFFAPWLRPYEHYIPVRLDLSDLLEKIQWAIDNDDEAHAIMERGRAVAERVLTDKQNDCYFYRVGIEWGELWGRGA